MQATHRCPKCQEVLPLSAFTPAPSRPHGISPYCVVCRREDDRIRRQDPAVQEARRAASRRYHERQRAKNLQSGPSRETAQTA